MPKISTKIRITHEEGDQVVISAIEMLKTRSPESRELVIKESLYNGAPFVETKAGQGRNLK